MSDAKTTERDTRIRECAAAVVAGVEDAVCVTTLRRAHARVMALASDASQSRTAAPKTLFLHRVLWVQRRGGWEPATLRECNAEIERLCAIQQPTPKPADALGLDRADAR